MKPTLTIKQTYHDALFFASSQQNKQAPETGINKNGKPKKKVDKSFFLVANELKVLMKLIHYSTTNENITYQDKDISKHTWIPEQSIINTIKSLKDKGYIINQTNKGNDNGIWYCKRIININWKFIESVYKLSQANTADLSNDKTELIQTLIEPENDSIGEVFTTPFYTAPVELEIKENINSEYEIDEIIDYRDTTEKFNIVDIIKPYMYDNDIFNDDKFNQCDVIVDEFKKIIDTSSFCFTLKQIKNCGEYLNGKLEFGTQEQLEQIINLINNFQPPVAA